MIKYPCLVGSTFTRVWESGRGARTVVLVHDAGLRLDWWSKTINALAEQGLHVWCLDLPGHGFAGKDPREQHSCEAYASFVRSFLEVRSISRPILVGAGFGGDVVAVAASADPAALAGLVLCAPTGLVRPAPGMRDPLREGLSDLTRAGARARAEAMVADSSLIDDGMVEDEYCINRSPGAEACFTALGRHLDDHLQEAPLVPRVSEVAARVPTLVVWGSDDAVVPAPLAPAAHVLIGQAQLATLDGAGHAAYFERPAAFNAAVLGLANIAHA